jgi:hypothetical protein
MTEPSLSCPVVRKAIQATARGRLAANLCGPRCRHHPPTVRWWPRAATALPTLLIRNGAPRRGRSPVPRGTSWSDRRMARSARPDVAAANVTSYQTPARVWVREGPAFDCCEAFSPSSTDRSDQHYRRHRGVGVTTEMTMTEEECQEFLSTRREAAKHIDPTTAEVAWDYGEVMDPYGIDPDLPDELKSIGRIYFARSPGSDIWVCFYDLPKETTSALWERHRKELLFPAGLEPASLQRPCDLSEDGVGPKEMSDNNAHIEAIAVWMQKVYLNQPEDMATFGRHLAELDGFDLGLLLFASKMIEGLPCHVMTDNFDTIRRCRSMVKHLGAKGREITEESGLTSIVFVPTERR